MRSKKLDSILGKITPELREKWRQERLEMKKKLTPQFQLGFFVGEMIVNNHLPTLSTRMWSRVVINVSEEDAMENERLKNEWYNSKSGEKWDLYYQHNIMLERKYLPNPLKCILPVINIEDENEFKKGLRTNLFDSDICSYNLDIDKIKIYDDDGLYFTIIEFEL